MRKDFALKIVLVFAFILNSTISILATTYKYDELNRLVTFKQ